MEIFRAPASEQARDRFVRERKCIVTGHATLIDAGRNRAFGSWITGTAFPGGAPSSNYDERGRVPGSNPCKEWRLEIGYQREEEAAELMHDRWHPGGARERGQLRNQGRFQPSRISPSRSDGRSVGQEWPELMMIEGMLGQGIGVDVVRRESDEAGPCRLVAVGYTPTVILSCRLRRGLLWHTMSNTTHIHTPDTPDTPAPLPFLWAPPATHSLSWMS